MVNMNYPIELLRRIENYQQKEGIATRTAAILELIRKGLELSEQNKNASS